MNLLLSWLSSKVLIPGTRSERTKGVWKRNKNLAKLKHHKSEKRRVLCEFKWHNPSKKLTQDSSLSMKQMGRVLNGTNFLIYV